MHFNLLILFFTNLVATVYPLSCDLPQRCRLEYVFDQSKTTYNERIFDKYLAIMCDIIGTKFEFVMPTMTIDKCVYNYV